MADVEMIRCPACGAANRVPHERLALGLQPVCGMIAPAVEQLAAELAGRARVAKLNLDENPATADRFGVRSIPTLLVLKGGREVDRSVGVQPKSEIVRRLERAIA